MATILCKWYYGQFSCTEDAIEFTKSEFHIIRILGKRQNQQNIMLRFTPKLHEQYLQKVSMKIFICSCKWGRMTSTLVQNQACHLLNRYACHTKNFHMKNCLACELGKVYSSPDRSIPLFSFLEIPLVKRTVIVKKKLLLVYTGKYT